MPALAGVALALFSSSRLYRTVLVLVFLGDEDRPHEARAPPTQGEAIPSSAATASGWTPIPCRRLTVSVLPVVMREIRPDVLGGRSRGEGRPSFGQVAFFAGMGWPWGPTLA